MFKNLIHFFFVFMCMTLIGCGLEKYQCGDLPPKTRLNAIEIGQSRDYVIRVLGMPIYQSSFLNDPHKNTFFVYAKIQKSSRAFLDPKEIDRQIYVIMFDQNDRVTDIRYLDESDKINVAYDPAQTKAGGRELSTLEQIAKNFGRYDAGGRDSTAR